MTAFFFKKGNAKNPNNNGGDHKKFCRNLKTNVTLKKAWIRTFIKKLSDQAPSCLLTIRKRKERSERLGCELQNQLIVDKSDTPIVRMIMVVW